MNFLMTMSKKARIAAISGVAALAAVGVGLGIWQPWRSEEPVEDDPAPTQQQTQQPQAPAEPEYTLSVGGDEVPSVLYEGEGWTMLMPEGWSVTHEDDGTLTVITSPDGAARVEVARETGSYFEGEFTSLAADETSGDRERLFYSGSATSNWQVSCQASEEEWKTYDRLMTAMARSLTADGGELFADVFVLAQEPDWQSAEGLTVLFLDKDGYVVDEDVEAAVEAHMLAWPDATKLLYTGQYRIDKLIWAGSYAGLTEGYIDVFRAQVSYQVAEGGEAEITAAAGDTEIRNGWATPTDYLYLAILHDGSAVEGTRALMTDPGGGWPRLAAELMESNS